MEMKFYHEMPFVNQAFDKIFDCLGEFLTFISQQYVSRTRFLPCNVLNMKANFLKVKEE